MHEATQKQLTYGKDDIPLVLTSRRLSPADEFEHYYKIGLDGRTFHVIGPDGGLLDSAVEVTQLRPDMPFGSGSLSPKSPGSSAAC